MDQLRTYGGKPGADRREERRARLLAVGRLLLTAAEGPAGFSVRGVCREAGLTPRYFYESFADAGELARAVYDDCIATITADTLAAMGDLATEPEDAMRAALGTLVDLIADDPARGRLLFSPALAAVPEIAEQRLASTRLFVQLVGSEATTRGDLPASPRVRVGAELMVGGVAQVVSAWLDGHLEIERDELVATLADVFLAVGEVVEVSPTSDGRPRG